MTRISLILKEKLSETEVPATKLSVRVREDENLDQDSLQLGPKNKQEPATGFSDEPGKL